MMPRGAVADWILRTSRMLVCVASVVVTAMAAEEPRWHFDLPAGDAAITLRQFAEVTGREILFAAEVVRGVQTAALHGEFSATEALQRMLANTNLQAIPEEAIAVRRIPVAKPRQGAAPTAGPSPSPPPDRPETLQPKHSQSPAMKNRSLLALLAAWLFVSGSTHAQNTPSTETVGTLTGSVSNAATGNLLEGAKIDLPERGLNTLTDNTGRFVLANLPSGVHEVVVSYIGLDAARTTVTIPAGQRTVRNFDLTTAIYKLDAFKVTGDREGSAAAITTQRNAPNVKNVVAMDSFGNLPNLNAGELAIRLPGVAGSLNDEGLVNGFTIRGMPPGLNVITVDGAALSNQFAMSRTASIHTFTGAMFEQLELTKGHTPDQGANSLGGTINLKSRSPLSMQEKRRINYNISTRVAPSFTQQIPLREEHRLHPLLNLSYQEIFGLWGGERNLGLAVNMFYSENASGLFRPTRDFQNTTAQPAYVWDYRIQNHYNNRKQASIAVKLDYRLSPATKISLNTNYNDANEPSNLRYNTRFFTTQSVGTTGTAGILPGYTDRITRVRAAPGSTVDVTGAVTTFMNRMRLVDLGIEHKVGRVELDANAVYNRTYTSNGNEKNVNLVNRITNVGWVLDRTESDLYPRVIQTEGPDFNDPANYRPNGLTNQSNQSKNLITEARTNARVELPLRLAPIFVKGGLQWRKNEVREFSGARRWNYRGTAALPVDPTLIMWESIKSGSRIPQWAPASFMHDRNPVSPELWTEDLYFYEQNRYNGTDAVTETISAGYAMVQGSLGRTGALRGTKFLAGVRIEKTDTESWGWVRAHLGSTVAQQQADPIGSAQRDYANSRRELAGSYTKSFPSVHISRDLTSNLKARASWSTSFGRPSMANSLPNESFSDVNQTLTINNPKLLPQTANNWDASLEYYFEPVGNLSVGWFHKTIKDYIVRGIISGTVASGSDNGYNGEYSGYTVLTTANGGTAIAQGWELSYQQQFTFLPGLLKGLGLNANYTLIDARGNFGGTTKVSGNEVPDFVPRTGNVSVSWRYGRFTTLVLYNYTGYYITNYSAASIGRNLYRAKRSIVNLGVTYRVRPSLNLSCDISNLFNEPQAFYRGIPDQMQSTILTGTTITFGVRGQF